MAEPRTLAPMQFFGSYGQAVGVTGDFRPNVMKAEPVEDEVELPGDNPEPVEVVDDPEAGTDPARPEPDDDDDEKKKAIPTDDPDDDDEPGGFDDILLGDPDTATLTAVPDVEERILSENQESTADDAPTGDD